MEKQPFSIYEVDQTQFSQSDWIILPPREQSIERLWAHLPTLGEFLTVRLGCVSGADDIFILPEEDILGDDTRLFVPMRSDREMKIYRTPEHVTRFAFYPFVAGRKITEEELKEEHPTVWGYLLSHRDELVSRSSVQR